jgi:hypothetical protein
MEHSRWSEATSLRRTLYYYNQLGPTPERSQHILCSILTPQKTLALLENLCQEGVLARSDASQIEEKVLGLIDATGRWVRLEIVDEVEIEVEH